MIADFGIALAVRSDGRQDDTVRFDRYPRYGQRAGRRSVNTLLKFEIPAKLSGR